MPQGLKSTVRLFADDTIAYLTITSENDALALQTDLNKLGIWEKKWKMEFHPGKCNVLTISRKPNPIKYNYSLHGHTLESVESAKYLGCLFHFLRRNLNIGSATGNQNAYNSLVRPIVEYASTVWDPYTQKDIHTLEMVQRRGARYVCNRQGNRSSVDSMLDTLKWKSLQHRRRDARLHVLSKTHHEDVAISKEERLIPPKRTTRNMHPLSFQVPSSSSDYRKYSFFPRTIRDWNSLPTNTAAATTLVAFKAQVSQLPH